MNDADGINRTEEGMIGDDHMNGLPIDRDNIMIHDEGGLYSSLTKQKASQGSEKGSSTVTQ